MSKILEQTLAGINKTEVEVITEKVRNLIEDSIIECESQISHLKTSTVPSLENKLKRANKELEKANKNLETIKFNFANVTSFENYIGLRESAQDKVDYQTDLVSDIQIELKKTNTQISKFEEVLADLKA